MKTFGPIPKFLRKSGQVCSMALPCINCKMNYGHMEALINNKQAELSTVLEISGHALTFILGWFYGGEQQ